MNCPKCKSNKAIKDGIVRGKQRYLCKLCQYHYTVISRDRIATRIKRQALQLYLEGLGFRSIGRFLNCSHVSVYRWIRSFGSALENIKSSDKAQIVELDEMHTFIGSKKTAVGYGLLLIDLGKDLSTASLAAEGLKPGRSFGKD